MPQTRHCTLIRLSFCLLFLFFIQEAFSSSSSENVKELINGKEELKELQQTITKRRLMAKNPLKKKVLPVLKQSSMRSLTTAVKYHTEHVRGIITFKSKKDQFLWLDDLPHLHSIQCDNKGRKITLRFTEDIPDLPSELNDLPVNVLISPRHEDCLQTENVKMRHNGQNSSRDSLALGHFTLKKLIGVNDDQKSITFATEKLPFFGNIDYDFDLKSNHEKSGLSTGKQFNWDVAFSKTIFNNSLFTGSLDCNPCQVSTSFDWSLRGGLSCSWLVFCYVITEFEFNSSLSADLALYANTRTQGHVTWFDRPDLFRAMFPSFSIYGIMDLGFYFAFGVKSDVEGSVDIAIADLKFYTSTPFQVYIKLNNTRVVQKTITPLTVNQTIVPPSFAGDTSVGFEFFPRIGVELEMAHLNLTDLGAGLTGRFDVDGNVTLSTEGEHQLCADIDFESDWFYYYMGFANSTFKPLFSRKLYNGCLGLKTNSTR